jgi:hypothetical protein
MAKYVVTNLGPVNHDGKDYAEGETIEMGEEAAAAAIKSGSLVEKAKVDAEAKAAKAAAAALAKAEAAVADAETALAAADTDEKKAAAEAALVKVREALAALG